MSVVDLLRRLFGLPPCSCLPPPHCGYRPQPRRAVSALTPEEQDEWTQIYRGMRDDQESWE